MIKQISHATVLVLICLACLAGARTVCRWEDGNSGKLMVPADTSFSPVGRREYRPASTPLERPSKPNVRLPRGLSEANVWRVAIIAKISQSGGLDSTVVIETRTGEIFIDKQEGRVRTVELIEYTPPIFEFGLFAMAGVSLGSNGLEPALGASPMQILGRWQLPILAADISGIGVGLAYRSDKFSCAAVEHLSFTGSGQSPKLLFMYNL